AQDKLEYDANGVFISWMVLDKNHQLKEGNAPNVARGKNLVNKYGYYESTLYYDKDLQPMVNAYGYWGNRLEFDDFGNMVMHSFLDGAGNPGPHTIEGLVYMKYTYDASGYNLLK